MFQLLRQPYPLNESRRHDFGFAVGAGLFVALFLLLFQPFGLDRWEASWVKVGVIAGYGVVTFVAIILWEFSVKRGLIASTFTEEKHTVGRQILYVSCLLLTIAAGNYLYSVAIFGEGESGAVRSFGQAMLYTLLVGIFPTVASVLLNYVYQLKKYSNPPQVLPKAEPQKATSPEMESVQPEMIRLVADNEKDSLIVIANQLLYIESADNYCMVVYEAEKEKKRELVRSSLSRLEEQIHAPDIVRCHRSYIVNLAKVGKVTGNAQGYKLHLPEEITIPVARRYNQLVQR
ncbi:LytR/AlgR family response regulator transcription factor [Telluribacter humicola]|uniref:LytR/AlgR family response regulator transcription factor n=1 Tax=Telluribacter humicola TaxID=1720261 RepID=UPI001A95B712|nr:LytTR family DNA-binding domain-containing protein [Telluribacter humicola]